MTEKCSFCGKTVDEIDTYLITAPFGDAAICWDCVQWCIAAVERVCIEKQLDRYWGA